MPLLQRKMYQQPSVFVPESLLREARRQKGIFDGKIPRICVLDPDGDIVRYLQATGQAERNPYWACYHTDLYNFEVTSLEATIEFGIVGCAVGAPYAVLIAEQMFVSGCEFLIDVTSSGQITSQGEPPYFVLIEKALRDEGTSYHYLPPSDYTHIDSELLAMVTSAFDALSVPVYRGATWTTDAPFRETEEAIHYARTQGILAVEMEAAALYAFATVSQNPIICFAHVTNQMGNIEGDFEKGEAMGSKDALQLIAATAQCWLNAKG